ncbi:MAG: hypothetical protein ACE5E5_09285 [Phycisphaerae bacterium]
MKCTMLVRNSVAILALAGWSAAFASGVEGQGWAFVTMQHGGRVTRGADEAAFPDALSSFVRRSSGVKAGKTVVTDASATADLALPAYQMAVRLGPSSELKLLELPDVDSGGPVSLLLRKGTALVVSRSSAKVGLRLTAGTGDRVGSIGSMGAAVAVNVDAEGVGFAVVSGVAYFALGAPAGASISEGQEVSAGQQIAVAPGAAPTAGLPDALSRLAATAQRDRESYQFGLRAGRKWVANAERGDLTPVRTPGGAPPSVLPEVGLSPQLAFDQARTGSVVQAPRTVRTATRTQGGNPVRSLLSSGLPSEVVVGRRIVTARFLGIRGGIRINPNFDPLIKLAGRPGR